MKVNIFLAILLVCAGILFSCKKTLIQDTPAEAAQWIKVVGDSPVFFIGKIRYDALNNLYCWYNDRNPEVSNSTAIVKLDADGNVTGRMNFDSLNIFDFLVIQPDELIVASSDDEDSVTLTKISKGKSELFGTYVLPFIEKTKEVTGMKMLRTMKGDYILSGTFRVNQNIVNHWGFMMMIGAADRKELWKKSYGFPQEGESGTYVTGCAQDEDEFILFGNIKINDPPTSSFFVLKCDADGDTLWSKRYVTSTYFEDKDSMSGYYCETSDILPSNDGHFFACSYNVLFNTPLANPIYTSDDNSARIHKITSDGAIDSVLRIKFDVQNQVADLCIRQDGGLFIGFNPFRLSNFAIVGERHSFVANVSADLVLENISYIQTQYSDYLGSVCTLPDGSNAVETMIQSFGDENYYLEVFKTAGNNN